jgi:hypothetical protein
MASASVHKTTRLCPGTSLRLAGARRGDIAVIVNVVEELGSDAFGCCTRPAGIPVHGNVDIIVRIAAWESAALEHRDEEGRPRWLQQTTGGTRQRQPVPATGTRPNANKRSCAY